MLRRFVLGFQHVVAVLIKLAGRHIHADANVLARPVAGGLDGIHDEPDGRLVGPQIRRKPALVAHGRVQTFLLENGFQAVKRLGAHLDGLGEGGGPEGDDHELLEIEGVGRMGTAVDDVHHGNGKGAGGKPPEIAVERQPVGVGRRPRRGHGDTEDRVGAELGLGGGAVEVDHPLVQRALVRGVQAQHLRCDAGHDVADGRENPFAAVALGALVAQLQGFPRAGRRPGRYRGAAHGAAGQVHVHLDGRVSA